MSMGLLALILFRSLSLSNALIYKRTGDEVVLFPSSAADLITFITWNHNNDIAMEWDGGEPSPYRQFEGCTTLDTRTGALTISNLTQEHSGNYTTEINNNRVAGKTEIQVISPVPKPTVSMWCDAEMTYCTLTCEGNTTDAGPVDYSWQLLDGDTSHKGQQVNLTKDDQDCWFQCEMKNPISSETSKKFLSPFSSSRNRITGISVLGTILLLIVLVGGIYMYVKCKSKKGKEDKGTVKENAELLPVVSNGVVPSLSIEESPAQKSSVVLDIGSQTAVMNSCETSNPGKTSEKPTNEPEISPDQVLVDICKENPGSSAQTENAPKKEEETLDQVLIDNPETPESNHQTEISPDQVHTGEENPGSSTQTENSPKKEEETLVQVLINNQGTPESNDQTATDTSEALTSVAESINEAATVSEDQETSRNDLKTAAFPDSEESSEESNGKETTRLLEEPNLISVSA